MEAADTIASPLSTSHKKSIDKAAYILSGKSATSHQSIRREDKPRKLQANKSDLSCRYSDGVRDHLVNHATETNLFCDTQMSVMYDPAPGGE